MTKDYAVLEAELNKLVERWRKTGIQAGVEGSSIDNLLARGHIHGMSDTLRLVADELETLLEDFPALK